MKLIPEWRSAHKFLSVQAMASAAALQGAWPMLPDDLRTALPPFIVHGVSVALLGLGIVGRLLQQDPPKDQP